MLSIESLCKSYRHHQAVRDISFQVKENECVALLGPNGAGKTTTLQMLSGLLSPTSGTIKLYGEQKADRSMIGYLPQYPAFYSWMTANEFLTFAGRLSGLSKKKSLEKIGEMLEFVGLQDAANKKIGGYSGGMKQRLGLAQALLHKPKLLILDEPVSALDPSGRIEVLDMMRELKKHMAVLFSTHVLHDAEQVCDQVVIMQNGEISWKGALQQLKEQHQTNVFTLTVKEKLKGWLEERPYISHVGYKNPSQAVFELSDTGSGRTLLSDCIQMGLTITCFEQKTESLEDVYLKVVHT
ncbi:ABC transporter ATP-binding protein [Bacillus mojavensis]|uniref:ABC transporter ATP-binding protein n=1 Tax=Bacillus mojavensis TaxID=72360 RepID=UPI002DBE726A|nr:ABC transporter ATP-binding protein [Bacillus mojavensis]MEC1290253.1 ABC transporter ATP-binding protein [Bacillus mojavensis]MEC1703529.1 ABC transporter ATP-binding protein [Bacillus mojavensis]MEC5247178.1 ABC transporter ATP-binding protein [Bacillus mojavensis]